MESLGSGLSALTSYVSGERVPEARDLSGVRVASVTVHVPVRAVVLTRTVWSFRLEALAAGVAASGGPAEQTTRTLDDFAWLRRALVYAVPGAIVPPGPLAAYAASRDSVLSGAAALTNEEAKTLQWSAQRFAYRLLAHVELRDEPIVKSFCFDEPERWAARRAEATDATAVAPTAVAVGAAWQEATETMGITSSANVAAARIDDADRAEMDRAAKAHAWVVATDRLVDQCERRARSDAERAADRGAATALLFDALADAADVPSSRVPHGLADKEAVRAPHVALLADLADLRAYLSAAHEALAMRDACRRESWTARRHAAEKRASYGEREAQLKLAAEREEAASATDSVISSLSLGAQSALAQYHARVALATKADVADAHKCDGLLRHRFDIARIRLYAQLEWLQSTWKLRCCKALHVYARAELDRRSAVATEFQGTITRLLGDVAVEPTTYALPEYAPPDFAKELEAIQAERAAAETTKAEPATTTPARHEVFEPPVDDDQVTAPPTAPGEEDPTTTTQETEKKTPLLADEAATATEAEI